jgi:Family of unknown function (DUF6042)
MALLREHTADEYWADHGILVVRSQGEGDENAGILGEGATGTQPGGTIAHAGAGWLWARTSSGDREHVVMLEAHDGPPPDDPAGWDDLMETPFLSDSTTVALGLLTGGDYDEHTLLLGRPGYYRVRVSCLRQPDEAGDTGDTEEPEGDTWRLQFWPAPGDPEPPRWLARGEPAVSEFSYEWDEVLDPEIREVLWAAQSAAREHPDGASAAQIAADKPAQSSRAETGPDAPLWPPLPRPPLTTGHPDQDAFEARLHAEFAAERVERERAAAEMAARFGLPAPVTVGDVLPLLAALGLLILHQDGGEPRYLAPGVQPRARDVLDLPAGRLAELDEQQMFYRYCAPATDLVAVTMWTPAGRAGTVADLAGRVLMPTGEVRATLRYAQRQQLLRVDGDPGDDASQLTLTVQPGGEQQHSADQPTAGEPANYAEPASAVEPADLAGLADLLLAETGAAVEPADLAGLADLLLAETSAAAEENQGAYARLVVVSAQDASPPLPQGAPPRAGVVTTSGDLVVWRDGDAEVLASVPAAAPRAVETPHGVVVLDLDQCVLVQAGGHTEVLTTRIGFRAAVSADGRHLALAQTGGGRRPKFSVQLIDLADHSRQTLPWPEDPVIAGVYGGAVFFSSAGAGGQRWTPGRDPEPLPWPPQTVDSQTGVMLVEGEAAGADGWLVIGRYGERANVLVTLAAELAPGGAHLISFRYEPPAVTLFDIDGADPRIWWLPEGCDTSAGPRGPVWEDAGHLLLRRPYSPDTPAVRLDIRTGDVEGVPLPGIEGYEVATFVESPG